MQQIRPSVETGEQIVVSQTTAAKAHSELEHEGILELRHGSGAYIPGGRGIRNRAEKSGAFAGTGP